MKKMIMVVIVMMFLFIGCKKDDISDVQCYNEYATKVNQAQQYLDNKQISVEEFQRRCKQYQKEYNECLGN